MDYPISGTPVGYQQIDSTGLASAVGLTVPAEATQALITVTAQTVRMLSGSNPTTTNGYPLVAGATILLVGNLSTWKFIRATSGAIVDVLYFR